jgi:hypothetical protein
VPFAYRLGVMVETPRAALRAAEIAQHASFLSFGTNDPHADDLRALARRRGALHGAYVAQGVFAEDPFHASTSTGWATSSPSAERGRRGRPDASSACARARRRAAGHRALPDTGLRLRVLLALPRPGRAALRRTGLPARQRKNRGLGAYPRRALGEPALATADVQLSASPCRSLGL